MFVCSVDYSTVGATFQFSTKNSISSANSQYELGYMYEKGKGVPQSDVKAMKWYLKAAIQGDTFAKDRLKEVINKKNSRRKLIQKRLSVKT